MELEVTAVVLGFIQGEPEPMHLSCSQMEMGSYAGPGSWWAAVAAGDTLGELSPEQLEAIRDHFAEYGAWDDDEVAAWTEDELRGLLMQELAADWRESWGDEEETNSLDLTEPDHFAIARESVEKWSREGVISGRLYPGDRPAAGIPSPTTADTARWFIYLGP